MNQAPIVVERYPGDEVVVAGDLEELAHASYLRQDRPVGERRALLLAGAARGVLDQGDVLTLVRLRGFADAVTVEIRDGQQLGHLGAGVSRSQNLRHRLARQDGGRPGARDQVVQVGVVALGIDLGIGMRQEGGDRAEPHHRQKGTHQVLVVLQDDEHHRALSDAVRCKPRRQLASSRQRRAEAQLDRRSIAEEVTGVDRVGQLTGDVAKAFDERGSAGRGGGGRCLGWAWARLVVGRMALIRGSGR